MTRIWAIVSRYTWIALAISAGCATTVQSAAELNAALLDVVPPRAGDRWPMASAPSGALDARPQVVIAWVGREVAEGHQALRVTRATREGWIRTIQERLEHSTLVAGVSVVPPDQFDDGVTREAILQLCEAHGADVALLFGFEVSRRRYHAFDAGSAESQAGRDVSNVSEVVTIAHIVGVDSNGVPILGDSQRGFASGILQRHGIEELERTSQRIAVDALADAAVRRLSVLLKSTTRS